MWVQLGITLEKRLDFTLNLLVFILFIWLILVLLELFMKLLCLRLMIIGKNLLLWCVFCLELLLYCGRLFLLLVGRRKKRFLERSLEWKILKNMKKKGIVLKEICSGLFLMIALIICIILISKDRPFFCFLWLLV